MNSYKTDETPADHARRYAFQTEISSQVTEISVAYLNVSQTKSTTKEGDNGVEISKFQTLIAIDQLISLEIEKRLREQLEKYDVKQLKSRVLWDQSVQSARAWIKTLQTVEATIEHILIHGESGLPNQTYDTSILMQNLSELNQTYENFLNQEMFEKFVFDVEEKLVNVLQTGSGPNREALVKTLEQIAIDAERINEIIFWALVEDPEAARIEGKYFPIEILYQLNYLNYFTESLLVRASDYLEIVNKH